MNTHESDARTWSTLSVVVCRCWTEAIVAEIHVPGEGTDAVWQ